MHHFEAHELADSWELRAGLLDADPADASISACLRECAAALRNIAVQSPAEGDSTDLADFLANTLGFVGDVDDAAAEIVAFLASKAKGTEPQISTAHGPWLPSQHDEGETYCKRCLTRSVFADRRKCDPHIVYAPNVQPKGTTFADWWADRFQTAYYGEPAKVGKADVLAAWQAASAQAPAPAPEVGAGEKWEADVECITDESGTDYSVSIRGPGLRNPDYSDVWLKKRPAEQLAKWLNKSVLPRFSAPAVKDDEPEWELPTPAVGDYVLATKWSDGDPGDNWALGFYTHSDTLQGNEQTRRYYVADSAGKNIRGNGFRKVHGPIRGDVGRWLLEVASGQLEASPPGVVNLWTMLTPFAFDLERDREPVSKPPVQGGQP